MMYAYRTNKFDEDDKLTISMNNKETNDIYEWSPGAIEIIWGSGGMQMSIDELLDWIKEHGYEILNKDNDNILIKMGDVFGSDDGAGEFDIPISYILENKDDFKEFKDIIECVNSHQD